MEDRIKKVKDGLGDKIENWEEKNPRRVYITVDRKNIREVARFIFEDCKARFIILTGIDTPVGYENLYHFDFDSIGTVVTVKTLIPKSTPEIDSIATIIPGANYIEREVYEMLGIKFTGHPDLRRILLSDDWPECVYPLRKDVRLDGEVKKD